MEPDLLESLRPNPVPRTSRDVVMQAASNEAVKFFKDWADRHGLTLLEQTAVLNLLVQRRTAELIKKERQMLSVAAG